MPFFIDLIVKFDKVDAQHLPWVVVLMWLFLHPMLGLGNQGEIECSNPFWIVAYSILFLLLKSDECKLVLISRIRAYMSSFQVPYNKTVNTQDHHLPILWLVPDMNRNRLWYHHFPLMRELFMMSYVVIQRLKSEIISVTHVVLPFHYCDGSKPVIAQ